jgi:uncharacterized protein (DUF58 family)
VLTRPGWAVLAGSIATLAAGRALALPELYLLGTTGLALVVLAIVLVRRPAPSLQVDRVVHPRRVHLGGRSRVELEVTNTGHRRAPVLVLHDAVAGTVGARVALAPLGAGQVQTAGYRLPTERRGLVRIGPLRAQLTDPFGLARRAGRLVGDTTLTVLPAIEVLSGVMPGSGLDEPLAGVSHPALGSAGNEEFSTLRPYLVGDDLRRVHWASAARSGELLVRQDDPPWQGQLTVLLDAREDRIDGPAFEQAVSAAASLLQAVAERGDRARLLITDGTDTGLVDARTDRETLLERLAVVDRHPGGELADPPLAGPGRTGGLVVVTGTPTATDRARVAAQQARFAAVRLVTIAARRDAAVGTDRTTGTLEVLPVAAGGSFAAAWALATPIGRPR